MFARMASSIGCPAYGPVPWLRKLARLLPTISYGPARYGAILVAEEVLDRLQCEQQGPGVYLSVLSFQVSQHGQGPVLAVAVGLFRGSFHDGWWMPSVGQRHTREGADRHVQSDNEL
jgi:hypothetical protein